MLYTGGEKAMHKEKRAFGKAKFLRKNQGCRGTDIGLGFSYAGGGRTEEGARTGANESRIEKGGSWFLRNFLIGISRRGMGMGVRGTGRGETKHTILIGQGPAFQDFIRAGTSELRGTRGGQQGACIYIVGRKGLPKTATVEKRVIYEPFKRQEKKNKGRRAAASGRKKRARKYQTKKASTAGRRIQTKVHIERSG